MLDHDNLIRTQFNGDGNLYKRFMQNQVTERVAVLLSTMEITTGKANAISAAVRVTQSMLATLKKDERDLDKIFNSFKDMVLQIADWDHDNLAHYTQRLQTERDKYTNAKATIITALTDIEGKLAAYEAERPTDGAVAELDVDDGDDDDGAAAVRNPRAEWKQVLKPFQLPSNATPAGLEDWERRFLAWFKASGAATSCLEMQQELFLNYLDATLNKRIKRKIRMDTPVVANDADGEEATAIHILRCEFRALHPTLKRQLALIASAQPKGQRFSDFFYTWDDSRLNAQLESVDFDTLSVILLMHATTDADLLKEFQRQKANSSTVYDLLEIATEYEANNLDRNFIASNRSQASAAPATAGRGKPIGNINAFFQQLKKEGRCARCLEKISDGHKERCPGKTAKCESCKRTGHLTTACASKHANAGASASAASASGGDF